VFTVLYNVKPANYIQIAGFFIFDDSLTALFFGLMINLEDF